MMELVNDINRLHADCVKSAERTLELSIKIGKMLSEIKNTLNHGDWIPWIEQNLDFDPRTARRYMQLYSEQDNIKGCKNQTEALHKVAKPKRTALSVLPLKSIVNSNGKDDQNIFDPLEKSYHVFGDENVSICSKKGMSHQSASEAIGHLILMNPNVLEEIKKYIKRMLVRGEKREILLKEIEEIELEIMGQVEILN